MRVALARWCLPTIALLALAAALFAGCADPSYQLEINVTDAYKSGDYLVIAYTLKNIGAENLRDVTLRINAYDPVTFASGSIETSPVDLDVWEARNFSNSTMYIGTPGFTFADGRVWVDQVGWNTEDSSW